MKYRFLGYPDKRIPWLVHGRIYKLVVTTAFWSKKPRIIKPFWCPYSSWENFYKNWRPVTMVMVRLERKAREQNEKGYIN